MGKRNPNREPAFAIVRVDEFQPETASPEVRITVKEIVFSLTLAQQEVERLSRLKADKGCVYFWTPTRVRRVV
jgi:hypothetical protein